MGHPWFKFNLSYPLTILGAALVLYLGSLALVDYYSFLRLTVKTEAHIKKLKVIKKSSSSYPIRARYTFVFKEKNYSGSTLLPPPYHLNRLSAQKTALQLEKRRWVVWLDPKDPSFSSLTKKFPVKRIIYFFASVGITFYLWFVETNSKMRHPAK